MNSLRGRNESCGGETITFDRRDSKRERIIDRSNRSKIVRCCIALSSVSLIRKKSFTEISAESLRVPMMLSSVYSLLLSNAVKKRMLFFSISVYLNVLISLP